MKIDKADIFTNARELFFNKGFKETSVSDITRKAGIAVGSFYKFYKSKDEVFLEVFLAENQRLTEQIVAAVDLDDDPADVIKEIVTRLFSGFDENPVLKEWYNKDIYSKLEDYHKTDQGSGDEYSYNLFTGIIIKWQEEGKLRSDIESDMILALFNTLQYVDLHKELIGIQYFPKLMDYLVEFIVNGLRSR